MAWEIGLVDPGTAEQPQVIDTIEASNPDAAIAEWIGDGAEAGRYGVREVGTDRWLLYRLDTAGLHPELHPEP
jgi:hypothetical protein